MLLLFISSGGYVLAMRKRLRAGLDRAGFDPEAMGSLVSLAVPIVLANLLQTVYNLTDTFWVGRLGAEAVASVSLSFPVIFLVISAGGGLAIAGTVFASQYKGKGNREKVNFVAGQTFLMVLGASLALSILGILLSGFLVGLAGAEEGVYEGAVLYMQISFAGMAFVFAFFAAQALMRGVGDVKAPLFVVLVTVILNFFLDPILIMGWGPIQGMGVAGAAIATVVCQGLAAFACLLLLFSGKREIHLTAGHFRPDFSFMKRAFFIGLPASVEQSIRSINMLLMTFLAAGFGTIALASYGLGTRIFSLVIIPSVGFSMATAALVGQCIGAGKPDAAERVARNGMLLSFFLLAGIGVLFYAFAPAIAELFVPENIEVSGNAAGFVRLMAFGFGFMGVQMVAVGALIGSGNTVTSMLLTIFQVALMFCSSFALSQWTSLGFQGMWWAYPISIIASSAAAVAVLTGGSWKKTRITEDAKMQVEASEEIIGEEGLN